MTPRLVDIARSTVERHGMLPAGSPVLAMVSGGADSTALVALLASGALGRDLRVQALHVDHMLRRESSDDAAAVSRLCESLGVPCVSVRFDVGRHAEEAGLNLEDAGRRVRYETAASELEAMCVRADVTPGQGRIVTGHTLDDAAETFLMRLAAGSGPRGLAGVPPVRGRIVRPLIDARRADIVAYLEAEGLEWREDVSNADEALTRNRVRHRLLPELEAMNPRAVEALARTMRVLSEEDALLDRLAARELVRLQQVEGTHVLEGPEGTVALDRAGLGALEPALARRVVRLAVERVFPDASRQELDHLDAVVADLADVGSRRDLPGGVHVSVEHDALLLRGAVEEPSPLAPALLEVPGSVSVADGIVRADPAEVPSEGIGADADDADVEYVDADRLEGPLTVGGAREGERMRPLGMSGTKKLSDVMMDAKVPARRRSKIPVVREGDRVVWVAGVRLSEAHRVTPDTRRVVRLAYTRER